MIARHEVVITVRHMKARVLKPVATFSWVVIATLLAHVLSYRLAFTDAHTRHHMLEASGHGWISMLWPALITAALAAVAGTWISARSKPSSSSSLRLLISGITAYVLIELSERVMHMGVSHELWHNLSSVGGWLPIVLGVLILCALAPLLILCRDAIAAAANRRTEPVFPAVSYRLSGDQVVAGRAQGSQAAPRAPPAYLSAAIA